MKKISFGELHTIRESIANYRYFIISGVSEPVRVYLRHYIEAYCLKHYGASKKSKRPVLSKSLALSVGFDPDEFDRCLEEINESYGTLKLVTYSTRYMPNLFREPRLCEVDLMAKTFLFEERQEIWNDLRTKDLSQPIRVLDDNTVEVREDYPVFCIIYLDNLYRVSNAESSLIATRRKIQKEMKELSTQLKAEDVRNTGRTSSVLWIDASPWGTKRSTLYEWCKDLLTDKATDEFLYECTGARGDLTMLSTLYNECNHLPPGSTRLGVNMSKAAIRKTDLYKKLLYINGDALAWDVIRYFADPKYKGVNLRGEVARSVKMESLGLKSNQYSEQLEKCLQVLSSSKRYTEKLLKVRSLLEQGSLSLSLGRTSLESKECRELCKKYEITYLTEQDLERASKYGILTLWNVLHILKSEYQRGKRALNSPTEMDRVVSGVILPLYPILRVYLSVGKHREELEECT